MELRDLRDGDWPVVWDILREVVAAGETIAYDPEMTEDEARAMWTDGRTCVVVDGGQVVGSAVMGANRPGRGAHVATATFVVAAEARGRGAGRALCEDALKWARDAGFAGMQFNAVVETNRAAVILYERLGFTIVGTVPGAFDHRTEGRVGLHVMYRAF